MSGRSQASRAIACCACSIRPASAKLVAAARSTRWRFLISLRARSALAAASSKRPAMTWAKAMPECIPEVKGSSGLMRSNRVRCSMAKICFPCPNPKPAAKVPGGRQVGVELSRALIEKRASVEVARQHNECMGGSTKRHRIILAQLDGFASEPNGFGNFFCARSVNQPSV